MSQTLKDPWKVKNTKTLIAINLIKVNNKQKKLTKSLKE